MIETRSWVPYLESRLPEALDLLRQMVEINSFTENKAGVAKLSEFTAQAFRSLGFTSERIPSVHPEYGDHLICRKAGPTSTNSLALISHLDTVFPPEEEIRNHFHWQPEGDRIFGPGTQDIKGGTAMMWLVLTALRHFAPTVYDATDWQLFWNSSEEALSKDFGDLVKARIQPNTRAALVFEAEGRLGEERLVVVSRKGRATWRIRAEGRAAHAGGKHRHGANAIVQLSHTLQKIAALTDHSKDLTFNVGNIRGGTVTNRVPHEATAEGEFRAFTPQAYQHGLAALKSVAGPGEVHSVADRFPCQVSVEILSETRPWPRNAESDRLGALWSEAGSQLGLPVGPESRGGLSDGNWIWDSVPTLDGLGPWGDNDHCSERSADGKKLPEFVDATSFVPKAAINMLAILKLLSNKPSQ